MAKDDWAIVVGIRRYPALGDLDGPENDAAEFRDWLVSPEGGGVPPEHVELITTPPEAPADVTSAQPAAARVQAAFDRLLDVSDRNEQDGRGVRIGRRLWVYMAGHGFEPQPELTALLTANATRRRCYHVPGKEYADWFRRAGMFEELVLFMDCCRETMPRVPPDLPSYVMELSPHIGTGSWLIGHATKSTRTSREKPIGGKARGVFTTALLAGLRGDAAEPGGTRVTAASLKSYLYDHMKDWLTPEELDDPGIPQIPDVQYDEPAPGRLVLATLPAPKTFAVEVRPPAGAQQLTILDGTFTTVLDVPVTGPPVQALLAKGLYLAEVKPSGARKPFGVPETGTMGGTTHVDF